MIFHLKKNMLHDQSLFDAVLYLLSKPSGRHANSKIYAGVRILDTALVAAANLSNRYLSERFLPDKAIDLMDEAASAQRLQ